MSTLKAALLERCQVLGGPLPPQEGRCKMSLSRNSLAAGVSLLALAAATQASASAFYLQEQSVRGTGRAYSGEVADKGVGSLWWNPAAIAGIEKSEAVF